MGWRILACSILLVFTPLQVHANPTAWLLIGLDHFEGIPYYRLQNHETRSRQLVRYFKEALRGFRFDYQIRDQATEADLFEALNSPDSVVVFWVGHSHGFEKSSSPFPAGVMLDAEGTDVTELFKHIHPNIRWLGVVGCISQDIFNQYRKQGYYQNNRLLKIDAFSSEIEPSVGLVQSLAAAYLNLRSSWLLDPEQFCRTRKSFQLSIQRSMPKTHHLVMAPAVRVEVGDRIVAVFPRIYSGQVRTQTAWMPVGHALADYTLLVEATATREPVSTLGQFSFHVPGDKTNWQLLTAPSGRALGKSRHVYLPSAAPDAGKARVPPC